MTRALADRYTSCDRYFSAVMGPTWPNRMYWHSGQSAGIQTNDLPTQGFNWPTIHHRLDEAGVSWATYFGNIPVAGFIQDLPGVSERIYNFGTFFDHAKAGTLPSVVYIDPSFYVNDDHPPIHPILGQELIASVYTALATSPQWPECTLVTLTMSTAASSTTSRRPRSSTTSRAAGPISSVSGVPAPTVGPYAAGRYVSSVGSTTTPRCSSTCRCFISSRRSTPGSPPRRRSGRLFRSDAARGRSNGAPVADPSGGHRGLADDASLLSVRERAAADGHRIGVGRPDQRPARHPDRAPGARLGRRAA
ncbi:MAG: hypothetical protein IPI49_33590 [Myxococcales bacterium]|nr:hypothetical protein [Myxococcales bacterium]